MGTKYMVAIVAMAVMVIGATTLAIDNAFTTKKTESNQVTSQTIHIIILD